MDPQKFGDSYDFVKSVPRQLFLPARCLKSNVTKLQSYKVSWQIRPRNWRAGPRRRKDSPQRIAEPDLGIHLSSVLRLIDTRRGSPNRRYANPPLQGARSVFLSRQTPPAEIQDCGY